MPIKSKSPVLLLMSSHWLSMLGAALVTIAGFSWLFVLPVNMRGHVENPYIGIIIFIAIPIVFFLGLILIPIGIWLAKRRVARDVSTLPDRRTALRRLGIFIVTMTVVNVVIASQVTYRAVEHMETVQFCGQTCHVMKPEFTAHRNTSHQQVACVECHVEPGATGWLKSKLAGTRQLVSVAFNTYPRPIESAMESNRLASASETCERCHWRGNIVPVRLRILTKFKDDEANTRSYTVLRMLVGGGSTGGIHGAHLGPGVQMRYAAADKKRQTIPWIEYKNARTGVTRTYLAADAKPESVASLPKYEMQCVDCHNRPTHTFQPADRALDDAMAAGDIPLLPYIKKTALAAVQAEYKSEQEAAQKIPAAITGFYQQHYPEVANTRKSDVAKAAASILAVYSRNVFPDLKVTWGTYPNNLGHTDYPGCFRCHDESHTTIDSAAEKKTISQDCSICHQALAIEETSPDVLNSLGLTTAATGTSQ